MIRHGDIMLKPVAAPKALGERSKPGERLTLATGEATGHAHVLHGLAVAHVPVQRNRALIEVLEPSALRHEEHREITVPPGWYEVIRQRVYTPIAPVTVRD